MDDKLYKKEYKKYLVSSGIIYTIFAENSNVIKITFIIAIVMYILLFACMHFKERSLIKST